MSTNRAGAPYDIAIIGGGINGCGIARDAAGRGLRVFLAERDDFASHTSSWSSKLIHGGLRYLETYQFRLVRESLKEREVLKRIAPHLTRPMQFVLPHEPSMRPAWMLQIGLWLYDHIGGKISLPASRALEFPHGEFGEALAKRFAKGFVYSDLQVDDARLTLANAVSAREKGAVIHPRAEVVDARREGDHWRLSLKGRRFANEYQIQARTLINAAGPWAVRVRDDVLKQPAAEGVRLVRGSHIVVPRVQLARHAYITQQPDGRVVFIIPWQDLYTLIGTTDVPAESPEAGEIASDAEIDYLLSAASSYLAKPLQRRDVVMSFAGVRPLYDDGNPNASKVTRDYVLRLDGERETSPVLHIYGGKLTTYRTLAVHALEKLKPALPHMGNPWTHTEVLPGGDLGDIDEYTDHIGARYPELSRALLEAVIRRHGSRATTVLGNARQLSDLGRVFGRDLTEREIEYMVQHEWAMTAEDVLTRRSKAGLGMSQGDREAVNVLVATLQATRTLSQMS